MKTRTFEYEKGYVLDFLFFPGRTGTPAEVEHLLEIIRDVNSRGMKLDYGIFKTDVDRSILDNMIFCLIKKGEEHHGFFYTVVVDHEAPLVHQGLVMVVKNDGVDLLTTPYRLLNALIFEELGSRQFFASNVSAVPKIVGAFCDLFTDVWPSPTADQLKCPYPDYRPLLDTLVNQYINRIYTAPKPAVLDKGRFVLKSPGIAMGFDTEFHKLARDSRFEINLFTFMWLRHDREEDMIQIGIYNQSNFDMAADARAKFKELNKA